MRKTRTNNIAARAGRWSAQHRKKAIVGWLVFVILAVFIGGSVGTKTLDDVDDNGIGESGRADKAVSQAFPDEVSESVMVQNKKASVNDPQFKAVVADVERSLGDVKGVEKLQGPYEKGNGGQLSEDGHSALDHLRPPRQQQPGGEPRGGDALDRLHARPAPRGLHGRGVRRRQRGQGALAGVRGRLPAGRDHLAAHHADHPHPCIRRAARGVRPPGAGRDGGRRRDRPASARSPSCGRWTSRSARWCF